VISTVNGFTPRQRNVINFAIGLGEAFGGGDTIEAVAQSQPAINFAASQGLEVTGNEILELVRKANFVPVGITAPIPVKRKRVRRERLKIDKLNVTVDPFRDEVIRCNEATDDIGEVARMLRILEHKSEPNRILRDKNLRRATDEIEDLVDEVIESATAALDKGIITDEEFRIIGIRARLIDAGAKGLTFARVFDRGPEEEVQAAEVIRRSREVLPDIILSAETNWALTMTDCLLNDGNFREFESRGGRKPRRFRRSRKGF
jgi:hypothetical protein